jgi:hypothetical protein
MAGPAAATGSWVHPASFYPDAARAELGRRRDQILVRASGRVLDLDEPGVAERFVPIGATRLVGREGAGPAPAGSTGERFDTVVATGVLAAFADLGSVAAALAELVVDDGVLLFVEPVGRPSWSHTVASSLDPRQRRAPWRGLHLDRDVPAAIRTTGLVICDLDRGELPAQPPSLRHWVSGRAVRIPGS